MNPPVTFSHHANVRMAERNVSTAEVLDAIDDPDRMRCNDNGIVDVWKALRGGELRVTYNAVYGDVITVCWSLA